MTPPGRKPPHGEDGFALIEVLVSALVLAIAAGAILSLLQATTRAADQERRHSEAQALAQEDQARLRTMRLATLNKMKQVNPIKLDGTEFTVESTGAFINNSSGAESSCAAGKVSADYVRITSTVTWKGIGSRPPVTTQSIVAPSSGSLDPHHGVLAISTTNAAGGALSGVGLAGSGPANFSGTTDAAGCANFADLPEGNYTVTPTAPGLIDKTGSAPKAQTMGVVPSSTQQVTLMYDKPGSAPVGFKYRVGSGPTFEPSKMDSILAFNSETGGLAKVFASGSGSRESSVTATSLFPFLSPYAVYAGYCEKNNPNPNSEKESPGAAAIGSVVVPPGAAAPTTTIQVPALNLTVKKSGTPIVGATVKLTETGCNVAKTFTTTTGGVLPDPGMPWGTYNICAQTTSGSSTTRKTVSGEKVQNLTSGTTVTIDLGSGTSSGACP
jgi:Tfp pilus assembly protein PilV